MRFSTAAKVEEAAWTMRLADLPRANNRALINSLLNGSPPYSPEEQKRDNIVHNVNDLSGTKGVQGMMRQYDNAFLKPGHFFKVSSDYGPKHSRSESSAIITEEINRQMKRGNSSMRYRECLRNIFAQTSVHGIGPSSWADKEQWCPTMHQMCDVMIPSGTLLTMENLEYFAIYRRYTAAELWRLTHGPKVDKAWQMDVVERCIKWATKDVNGQTITETDLMSPERMQEAIKADLGYWSIDTVPTINCWDFYFLLNESDDFGWRRRIVLDTPSLSDIGTSRDFNPRSAKNILGERNQFLYNPEERNYASKLSNILSFMFGDGSVVAPFRYHSVRSYGFLVYAVCQLQNRLKCRFSDSVFESLLNYFRISNPADEQRVQQMNLVNLGIIPEGVTMVGRNERWQIDQNLVNMAMSLNRQSIADSSTSFSQDFGAETQGPEKTATQIMAEVNASSALTGSMLSNAYNYQEDQYREIGRRFCLPNSKDGDVKAFRAACLRRGVPVEALCVDYWDIAADRVIGSGNKQLELASVQLLMAQIDRFEPDGQRLIMKMYSMAALDNASMAAELVPNEPNPVTNSVHDAQLSAAPLMMGMVMGLKQGVNHGEYAATLIGALQTEIAKANQNGGMADQDAIAGMQNLAGQSVEGEPIQGNGAANHIAILAQNEEGDQTVVKELTDALAKSMNEVRAFAQRLQEQQAQPEAGAQQQLDPADVVKLKGAMILAEAKAENMKAAQALKLQQKQQSHEQKLEINASSNAIKEADQLAQTQADISATDLTTAAEIRRQSTKPVTPSGP